MALDPRTPVIVGVGQVTNRPGPTGAGSLADRPEPVGLMVEAVRAAVEDCDGAAPGGPAPPGAAARRVQSLRVANPLSWHYVNPGLLVAEALGIEPGRAAGHHHRGQQPPEPGQRHRPGHRPGRAGRGRAGRGRLRLHPGGRPPARRPAPPALDGAAGRHPPADRVRERPPGHHRGRGGAGARPAHPRLPPVRERPAGRGRPVPRRAPAADRRSCGPASPRWRRPTPTPGCARPAPAEEIVTAGRRPTG